MVVVPPEKGDEDPDDNDKETLEKCIPNETAAVETV